MAHFAVLVEQAALARLDGLGYAVEFGPGIAPGETGRNGTTMPRSRW